MNGSRNNQSERRKIRPPQRPGSDKLHVGPRSFPQPSENIQQVVNAKYSSVTPIYKSPSPSHIPRKFKKKHKPVAPNKTKISVPKKPLASTINKTMVLNKAIKTFKKKQRKEYWHKTMTAQRLTLGSLLILILGITGYVSVDTWLTNNWAEQVLASPKPSIAKSITANDTSSKTQQANTSQGANVPYVNPLNNYKVAPDLPKAIYISSINVAARLMPMSLNHDDTLQAPKATYDAGWYTSSAKPGQPGAMLIDGHASETGTHYGLLGYLTDIKLGATITIERGDGVRFNYTVVNTKIVPLNSVNMQSLLTPYNGAAQGVNLIACTGKWIDNNTTLDHRILVFAVLRSKS